jgi:hypothetical protein
MVGSTYVFSSDPANIIPVLQVAVASVEMRRSSSIWERVTLDGEYSVFTCATTSACSIEPSVGVAPDARATRVGSSVCGREIGA